MNFTFDQTLRYFQYRLPNERLNTHERQMVHCVFHSDRTPSLSIDLSRAVWKCHGCNEGGGVYAFEAKMFPANTADENWAAIEKICGLEPSNKGKRKEHGPLIATHQYVYADGKPAFEKLRYAPAKEGEKKSFVQRMPDGKGGWTYNLNEINDKPLYRLPDVVRSSVVLIAEGELKADALAALDWASVVKPNGIIPVVSATCNFDGAGKWIDTYSVYMAGKKVFIFPDNDDIGRNHAKVVAQSVSRYAISVHIVELFDLEDHGDIINFLEKHTINDVVACIKKAVPWTHQNSSPDAPAQPWLVSATRMVINEEQLNWLVEGVVHAYSKGIFVAGPKAGKSLTALDMAVALAANQSWCGCAPAGRQVRCAVISREDPSFITQKRTFDFARGRGLRPEDLEDWLFFNTRDQSRTFYLENDSDCETAIKWIKQKEIEFAIFDVLNLLHAANENSNTEMTAIMKRISNIRDETNISLALIHHTPHSDPKRARGAGAIESWWEWKVVVQPDPEDDARKTMSFISKACRPHPPVTIFIRDANDGTALVPAVPNDKPLQKPIGKEPQQARMPYGDN